ncbi:hypothetical protein [Micromonospora chalcea]|uniref:hypothetical protein n=1 Tax=Micromonospora chalcea TaxID=1874 RepID=UPI003D729C98
MGNLTRTRPTGEIYDVAAAAYAAALYPDAGPDEVTRRGHRMAGDDALQALVDSVWADCCASREHVTAPNEAIWRALLAQSAVDPALAAGTEGERAAHAAQLRDDPALLAAIRATWARAREEMFLG